MPLYLKIDSTYINLSLFKELEFEGNNTYDNFKIYFRADNLKYLILEKIENYNKTLKILEELNVILTKHLENDGFLPAVWDLASTLKLIT